MYSKVYSFAAAFRLVCLVIGVTFFTLPVRAQSLVGKWEGVSEGEVGKILFEKKGYVTFFIKDQPMGGKKFSNNGIDMMMKYEVNDDLNPHTIDIILYTAKDKAEISRMLGIYKFVNDNTLVLSVDFEGKARPDKFDPENLNQISLKRLD